MKKPFKISVLVLGLFVVGAYSAFGFQGPDPGQDPGTGSGALHVTSDGDIGFGTTNPQPETQAEGFSWGNVFTAASSSNPGISVLNTSGSGKHFVMYANENGDLGFYDATTGAVRLQIQSNGNIAVASTTNADSPLHVFGTSRATSFSGVGTNLTSLSPSNITASDFASGNYAFPSALAVGTSTTVGLPSNGLYVDGNVGLGTMDPNVQLHVTDSGRFAAGNGYVEIGLGTNSDPGVQWNNTDSSEAFYLQQGAGGGLSFRDAAANVHLKLDNAGGVSVGVGPNDTDTGFSTPADGELAVHSNQTEVMRYSSDGDVGIGTTTPSSQLHVIGDLNVTSTTTFNGVSYGWPTADGSDGQALTTDGSGSLSWSDVSGGGGGGSAEGWRRGSDGVVDLATSTDVVGIGYSTTTGKLAVNGDVGIGTDSPARRLDVSGDIEADQIYGSDGLEMFAPNNMWLDVDTSDAVSNRALEITHDNRSETLLRVQENGRVGIGTTTPSSRLDVADGRISNVGTPTQSADAATKSYVDSSVSSGDDDFAAVGGGDPSLTGDIYHSGSLGVGTSTISDTLSIDGGLHITEDGNASGGTISTGGNNSRPLINMGPAGDPDEFKIYNAGEWRIGSSDSSDFYLMTNNTSRLYIQGNGDIGVGTTTPANALHVVGGNINAGASRVINVGPPTQDSDAATKNYVDSTAGGGFTGGGTANYIAKWTNSSNLSTTTIYESGGQVGIGDSSPSIKLDVNGSIYANTYYDKNNTSWFVNPSGNSALSGDVGIGTTTPSETLEIEDSVTDGNVRQLVTIRNTASSNNTTLNIGVGEPGVFDDYALFGRNNTRVMAFTPSNNFQVMNDLEMSGTNAISNTDVSYADITLNDGSNNMEIRPNTDLIISPGDTEAVRVLNGGNLNMNSNKITSLGPPTVDSDAATKNYVDSTAGGGVPSGADGNTLYNSAGSWVASNNIYVASSTGNVGIGTTSGSDKLTVAGDVSVGYQGEDVNRELVINSSDVNDKRAILRHEGGSFIIGGSVANQNLDIGDTSGANNAFSEMRFNVNGNGSGGVFRFYSSQSEIARMNNAGDLMIGTTTNAGALNVGNGRITNVGAPTQDSDAATKNYVDSTAGGGFTGGGTANYIAKWTNSSNLSTTTIYESGGQVGIGDSSPSIKLDVNGSIYANTYYDKNNTSWFVNPSGDSSLSGLSVGTTTAPGSGDVATFIGGDVGIGTTNATRQLEVQDNAQDDVFLRLVDKDGQFAEFRSHDNDAVIETGGDPSMWIEDNNRVGIGNDFSPDARLDITADGGSDDLLYLSSDDETDGDILTVLNNGRVGIGTTTPDSLLDIEDDHITISGLSSASNRFFQPVMTDGTVGWTLASAGGSQEYFDVRNGDMGTYAMRLNTSSQSLSIGTSTNPSDTLYVDGRINVNDSRIINLGPPTQDSDAATKNYVDSTAGGGVPSGTDGQTLFNSAGSWVASNNIYVASSTSNVGIGATSPDEELEVNGEIEIAGGVSADDTRINFAAGDKSNRFQIETDLDATTSNDLLGFRSTANDDVLVLKGNGNVGVNVADPAATFEVAGNVRANQLTDRNNTNYYINPSGSSNLAGSISFSDLSNSDAFIDGGGGTSRTLIDQPSPELHIGLDDNDSGHAELKLQQGSSASTYAQFTDDNEESSFLMSNFGIQDNSPSVALDVGGTIYGNILYDKNNTSWFVNPASNSVMSGLSLGTTTTPTYDLEVNGDWILSGGAQADLNMNGNDISGVGKLSVSTIDPLYEINGKKYATYVSDTVGGIKTELHGKVDINSNSYQASLVSAANDSSYRHVIDFADLEEGSDMWLFEKTMDQTGGLEEMIVSLTAEGANADLWYDILPEEEKLIIYSDRSVTASYHLVAPRHDADEWPTRTNTDEEPSFYLE